MELVTRFFAPPADHFFLLGPRGTGKTLLAQALFPQAVRIDLLEPETLRALSARPELRKKIPGKGVCPVGGGGRVGQNRGERHSFVAETQSSAIWDDLRDKERAQVKCGGARVVALRIGKVPTLLNQLAKPMKHTECKSRRFVGRTGLMRSGTTCIRAQSVDDLLTHETLT